MTKPARITTTRREFLKQTALTASLLATPSWIAVPAQAAEGSTAPSERVTVGLIGRGAMGSGHLRRLAGDPAFELVGVCDVDRERRERGKEDVEAICAARRGQGTFRGCTAYNDYRELLARPDLDAVVIATPDHWHTLQSIDALKAGKDVYCEKPISITIQEGRELVRTAQRYGRVLHTGTQYRSIPAIRKVCQFIRDGGLGKVKSVFTLLNNIGGWLNSERCKPFAKTLSPETCGSSYPPMDFALPADPTPEGLDWDLWVGPAAWRPYNRLYHINPSPGVVPWAFCEAFGVTSLTWFLAHAADVIQYALGVEKSGPVEIIHPSTKEFPTLTCKYADGTLLHFVDHWGMVKDLYKAVPATAKLSGNFGGIFVGERGWVTTLSAGGPIEGGPEEVLNAIGLKTREVNMANNHHANWRECIRTRQQTTCPEELGHRTATLGHLTNIAFWTGRSLKWDPAKEEFTDNDMANRLRSRPMRAPWRV